VSKIDFLVSLTMRLINLVLTREEDGIRVFREAILKRWQSQCARNLTLPSLLHPWRSWQVTKSLRNSESTLDHPGRDSVQNNPRVPPGRFTYRVRHGSRERYTLDPTRTSLLFSDSAHDEWLNSLKIRTERCDSGERGEGRGRRRGRRGSKRVIRVQWSCSLS